MKKQKIQNSKNNGGITLITLIITVIIMLILASVTVVTTINGGLFEQADKAAGETQNFIDKQQMMEDGKVYSNGVWYDDIDSYIKKKPSENQENNIKIYAKAEKNNEGFLTENATYSSGNYIAVIPKGFKVSDVTGESAIATGLVIKDAKGNEFVWIPVTKELENLYSAKEGYLEPSEVELDTGKGYDFTSEYREMVTSVNKYNGFYIGRYETTTDTNSNIGSKYNTPVLYSNNWYNLYRTQKNANIQGNGNNLQTAMIYGVLWDETMAFISQNDANYDNNSDITGCTRYEDSTVRNSGVTNTADECLNIWGLSYSYLEWTQETFSNVVRVCRGAVKSDREHRHYIKTEWYTPIVSLGDSVYASRLIMYIL